MYSLEPTTTYNTAQNSESQQRKPFNVRHSCPPIQRDCTLSCVGNRQFELNQYQLIKCISQRCIFVAMMIMFPFTASVFEKFSFNQYILSLTVNHILIECPQFNHLRQQYNFGSTMKDLFNNTSVNDNHFYQRYPFFIHA